MALNKLEKVEYKDMLTLIPAKNLNDMQDSIIAIQEVLEKSGADISQIAPPTIVNSIDEMTDTSKHYVLDGYIYAYMSSGSGLVPAFTNLADPTLATDTALTPASAGWIEDKRINSSYQIVDAAGVDISNIISTNGAQVLRVKGFNLTAANGRIYLIKNNSCYYHITNTAIPNYATIDGDNVEITTENLRACLSDNGKATDFDSIRIGGALSGTKEDVIITLDEEITYSEVTGYEWTNTGLQYTATLYTDLIGIVDENNVIRLSANNLPSGTYTLKYGDENFETIGTITVN